MLRGLKRTAALSVTAAALAVAAGAVAATPAFAYHIDFGTYGSGGAAPIGTTFSMVASPFELVNSSGGAIWYCTSSTLSGATSAASGTTSNRLSVTSGSFTGCTVRATGQPITLTPSFTTPWYVTPTAGGPSPSTPFAGSITNVNVKWGCGSNSETFTGTLTTGAAENNVAGGSNITLNNAQSLSLASSTGGGCGLPGPYGVTAVYTLSKVNGAAVTAASNLWLLQN